MGCVFVTIMSNWVTDGFVLEILTIAAYWHHIATWIWVNIVSGDGFLPDGTKPLSEPMLTYHQWSFMAFFWRQFHKKWSTFLSLIWVWKWLIQDWHNVWKWLIQDWHNISQGLTYWGRVMQICISKLTIIDSDNGLSPGRCQAIIWTTADILPLSP